MQIIKKIIAYFFKSSNQQKVTRIPKKIHNINLKKISPESFLITNKLISNNFEAYVVGGGVRDTLLSLNPKDFDIVTNATPKDIKKIFPKSREIGRRFKIIHITLNNKIIEVTTFRSAPKQENILLTDDNQFGNSLFDDIVRRDFTINALCYCPKTDCIIDFLNGFEHIKQKKLITIGEVNKRFIEDPLRLLRAIRFIAKLDYDPEPELATAIENKKELLGMIPSSRLIDEVRKIFLTGHSLACFQILKKYLLFDYLFLMPESKYSNYDTLFLEQIFRNSDNRYKKNKPVRLFFILASIYWSKFYFFYKKYKKRKKNHKQALVNASKKALNGDHIVVIPKNIQIDMIKLWDTYICLLNTNDESRQQILSNKRENKFNAAYDFLKVLSETFKHKHLTEAELYWRSFYKSSSKDRQ